MKEYLCVICKKYTKEMLSDQILVTARNEYEAVAMVAIETGMPIDGSTNYLDFVEL